MILDFFFEDQDLVIRSPAEKTIGFAGTCGRLWKRNILLLKSIVSIIGIIEINCFNNIFVLKSTLFTTSARDRRWGSATVEVSMGKGVVEGCRE